MSAVGPTDDAEPDPYAPYVPKLVAEAGIGAAPRLLEVAGALVFLDVSGFTALSERLAAQGRGGAERLGAVLDAVFHDLLGESAARGGDLLKFGGDALLIHFGGPDCERQAADAAIAMRRTLHEVARAHGERLGVSIGVHAAPAIGAYLVGRSHLELLVIGPDASTVADLEHRADRGQILVSDAIASKLTAAMVTTTATGGLALRTSRRAATGGVAERGPEASRAPTVAVERRAGLGNAVPVGLRGFVGTAAGRGEHRWASIAFISITGTDVRIAHRGAAALVGPLHRFVELVQEACERWSVCFLATDIMSDGTKIILCAGLPTTAEEDEVRLVRALLDVMPESFGALQLRAGIHRGLVYGGDVGAPFRRTYTALGDTVNVAARLMGSADAGQIVASADVVERLGSRFVFRPTGSLLLRGRTEAVTAYVVERSSDRGAVTSDLDRPLIGRADPWNELSVAWESAERGSGSAVELRGEPGSGKSHLLHHVAHHASEHGATLLSITGDQLAAATPFAAFGRALRALFGISLQADPEQCGNELAAAVSARAPELVPLLPLLARVVDASVPRTDEVDALDERFMADAVERSVESLLAATGAALFFAIDDVRFLDHATTELLRALARRAPEHPWLFVVAQRNGEPTVLDAAPLRIDLTSLTDSAARRLAGIVLGDRVISIPLDPIVRRAAGNPLFLIELLTIAGDRSTTDGLPQSLEVLFSGEIDRLEPARRRLLREIAVVGSVFPRALVDRLFPHDDQDGLSTLLDAGLLVDLGDGRLAFRTSVLRDTAYAGLPYRDRATGHRAVADALAQQGAPPELLAPHYFLAGDFERALSAANTGGRRAQSILAHADAVALFRIALDAASRCDTPAAEIDDLRVALGDSCEQIGDYDEAARQYARARRNAPPAVRASLMRKEGVVRERAGSYKAAAASYARARAVLREVVDTRERMLLSAQISVATAALKYRQGQYRSSIGWCERAIVDSRAVDAAPVLGHAYFVLAGAYADLGDPRARTYGEVARPIFEECGDLSKLGIVLNNFGVDAYFAGNWKDARDWYAQSLSATERAGDVVMAATVRNNIAEILSDQGHFDAAVELFEEASAVWRGAMYPLGVALATSNLGRVAARRGDATTGGELLDSAIDQFAALGSPAYGLEARARRIEAALFANEATSASAEALEGMIERARHDGSTAYVAPTLWRLLGLVEAARGDEAAARAAFATSVELALHAESDFEYVLTIAAMGAWASPAERARAESLHRMMDVVSIPTPTIAGVRR